MGTPLKCLYLEFPLGQGGLRIQHCLCGSMGWIPGPGTSICHVHCQNKATFNKIKCSHSLSNKSTHKSTYTKEINRDITSKIQAQIASSEPFIAVKTENHLNISQSKLCRWCDVQMMGRYEN